MVSEGRGPASWYHGLPHTRDLAGQRKERISIYFFYIAAFSWEVQIRASTLLPISLLGAHPETLHPPPPALTDVQLEMSAHLDAAHNDVIASLPLFQRFLRLSSPVDAVVAQLADPVSGLADTAMGSPSAPSGAGQGNGVALETNTEEVKAADVAPTVRLEGELAAQFQKVRYRVMLAETGFDVGA